MRVLYFANNWLGWRVLEWLKSQDDEIVGVVAHPEDKAKYRDEICETSRLPEHLIFDGSRLGEAETVSRIQGLGPQIGVSVLFGFRLEPPLLRIFEKGCINLHLSFLPFNRGANPNVWAIIDQTPAGVTLHYMDEGIDSGPTIGQEAVETSLTETGESLYRKLELAGLELFKSTWPSLDSRDMIPRPQPAGLGTTHRVHDLKSIDRIDLDKKYVARDLINILRARTFDPYPGAFFEIDARRIYLSLRLREEE